LGMQPNRGVWAVIKSKNKKGKIKPVLQRYIKENGKTGFAPQPGTRVITQNNKKKCPKLSEKLYRRGGHNIKDGPLAKCLSTYSRKEGSIKEDRHGCGCPKTERS